MSAVAEWDSELARSLGEGERQIVCATDDFEAYRGAVNAVYYPARMELLSPGARLCNARMSAFRLTDITVGIVRFGAEVSIDPGDMGGYHVDLPLTGSVATSCGGQEVVATPACAAVYSPGRRTFVRSWGADASQISVKIDRGALEAELGRILGRPVDRRVGFDIGFDMTTAGGRRWWSTLQILFDTVARPGLVPDAALVAQARYLERALIAGLLAGQPHTMSQAIADASRPGAGPVALRKVVDAVAAAPGAQYTVMDLAELAGVGVRQLQKLFAEHYGMSPAQYLRNTRLDGVRAALLSDDESTTVSAVAYRWGFNHLGRFAAHYERRFGETPSQTLRRR